MSVVAIAALAGCGSGNSTTGGGTRAAHHGPNRRATVPSEHQPSTATQKPTVAIAKTLPRAPKAGTGKHPQLKLGAGESLPNKLATYASDVGGFWQAEFTAKNAQFPSATVDLITTSVSTACGSVASTDSPSYCAADSSINLPLGFFQQVDSNPSYGDIGSAVIVGLMWSYHVEKAVGVLNSQGQSPSTPAQIKQTAMCLDGVWSYSVNQRGLLDPGDVQKIVQTVETDTDAPGTPADQSGGTAKQLVAAFAAGAQNGDPSVCFGGGSSGSGGSGSGGSP